MICEKKNKIYGSNEKINDDDWGSLRGFTGVCNYNFSGVCSSNHVFGVILQFFAVFFLQKIKIKKKFCVFSGTVNISWGLPPRTSWNGPLMGYNLRVSTYNTDKPKIIIDQNVSTHAYTVAVNKTAFDKKDVKIELAAFNKAGMGVYSQPIYVLQGWYSYHFFDIYLQQFFLPYGNKAIHLNIYARKTFKQKMEQCFGNLRWKRPARWSRRSSGSIRFQNSHLRWSWCLNISAGRSSGVSVFAQLMFYPHCGPWN